MKFFLAFYLARKEGKGPEGKGREEGRTEAREGWKDGRKEGWKEGRREGRKEGRTERGKDGRREGGKEGRKEVTLIKSRVETLTWQVANYFRMGI